MSINWRYWCGFGFQITFLLIDLIVSGSGHSNLLTITRTHLAASIARDGIRAKYLYHQTFVAQSEVALAHHSHRIGLQPRNCKLSRYHHHHRVALLRSQDFVISLQNGGCSPESATHARMRLQHRDKAKQHINIHSSVCLCIFESCALWSYSA